MRLRVLVLAGAAALGLGVVAGPTAEASTLIALIQGNDCAGIFNDVPEATGTGFSNCVARFPLEGTPSQLAPTPVIIKFAPGGEEGSFTIEDRNEFFSTVTGDEFEFFPADEAGTAGSWTYTPGEGDPLITAFVAKGGANFNLFTIPTTLDPLGRQVGTWLTPETCGRGGTAPCGLSHLTFYDTSVTPPPPPPPPPPPEVVPEPASLGLLGAGLLGLGFAARRRRSV